MTMVGTLRKNRVGVPKLLFDTSNKENFSSRIWYEEKLSNKSRLYLTEYTVTPKSSGRRNIVMMSTLPPYLGVTKDSKKKPAISKLYDYTKGGVDIFDQRLGMWTSNSKHPKWPLVVFSYVLDSSRICGASIFCLANGLEPRNVDTKQYLYNLSMALILPHVYERKIHSGIQSTLSKKIARTIEDAVEAGVIDANPHVQDAAVQVGTPGEALAWTGPLVGKRKRCKCCSPVKGKGHKKSKDNLPKSKKYCQLCVEPVRDIHIKQCCTSCAKKLTQMHTTEDKS